ncbi:hypothetical protein HD553DRAFT_154999 [Filobasidium floriforme]|uniref:uncharacterized protein n=1 Tax=Filobasidium floriforme TaxID=5210 RepID=UPI001E8D587D|nr:uncharacterized protein HD553DRAFT_154999 [Filobasidium floriforme]KAH8089095.1 hypothetical protein HD553DRAFT_154999 [Filobasidium floriforme]
MDLDDNAKGLLGDDRTPVRADAEPGETVEVILSDGTRRSISKEALYLSPVIRNALAFSSTSPGTTESIPLDEDPVPMGHLLDLVAALWSPWNESVFELFPPSEHADAVYKLADKYDIVGPVCYTAAFKIHQRMHGSDELHFDCLKWAVTTGDLRLAKYVLNHAEMFNPIDWDRKQIEILGWARWYTLMMSYREAIRLRTTSPWTVVAKSMSWESFFEK